MIIEDELVYARAVRDEQADPRPTDKRIDDLLKILGQDPETDAELLYRGRTLTTGSAEPADDGLDIDSRIADAEAKVKRLKREKSGVLDGWETNGHPTGWTLRGDGFTATVYENENPRIVLIAPKERRETHLSPMRETALAVERCLREYANRILNDLDGADNDNEPEGELLNDLDGADDDDE